MAVNIAARGGPILAGRVGSNAELIADIFDLYVPEGSVVADVTFGRGAFWNNIDRSRYQVLATDLATGVDFRNLVPRTAPFLLSLPPDRRGRAETALRRVEAAGAARVPAGAIRDALAGSERRSNRAIADVEVAGAVQVVDGGRGRVIVDSHFPTGRRR